MIRHVLLMLALAAIFAAVGCATESGARSWDPPASSSSPSGGSCPSCH